MSSITWNMMSPMRTGCVSNPKLWNKSFEFLTRVYPPNCKNVRICRDILVSGKYKHESKVTLDWKGQPLYVHICSMHHMVLYIYTREALQSGKEEARYFFNVRCHATKVRKNMHLKLNNVACPVECYWGSQLVLPAFYFQNIYNNDVHKQ